MYTEAPFLYGMTPITSERNMGMFEQVTTVFTQVIILFVLIGVGFVCGKVNMFQDESIAGLTSFTLHFVTPAAVIDSFCREFRPELLTGLVIVLGAALFMYWQIGAAANGGRYPAGVFSGYAAGIGILGAQAFLVRVLEKHPEARAEIEAPAGDDRP